MEMKENTHPHTPLKIGEYYRKRVMACLRVRSNAAWRGAGPPPVSVSLSERRAVFAVFSVSVCQKPCRRGATPKGFQGIEGWRSVHFSVANITGVLLLFYAFRLMLSRTALPNGTKSVTGADSSLTRKLRLPAFTGQC